jgi:hypothetical protein
MQAVLTWFSHPIRVYNPYNYKVGAVRRIISKKEDGKFTEPQKMYYDTNDNGGRWKNEISQSGHTKTSEWCGPELAHARSFKSRDSSFICPRLDAAVLKGIISCTGPIRRSPGSVVRKEAWSGGLKAYDEMSDEQFLAAIAKTPNHVNRALGQRYSGHLEAYLDNERRRAGSGVTGLGAGGAPPPSEGAVREPSDMQRTLAEIDDRINKKLGADTVKDILAENNVQLSVYMNALYEMSQTGGDALVSLFYDDNLNRFIGTLPKNIPVEELLAQREQDQRRPPLGRGASGSNRTSGGRSRGPSVGSEPAGRV